MEKSFLKKNWWKRGFLLLGLLYLATLLCQFFTFDFNQMFGYLDPQLFWQGLSDLSAGKVIYRNFYWEYGFLYLALGLPFFLLLGKTFLSSILIRLLILPSMAILLSFFLAKKLLKKEKLFFFLLLLFLYNVNRDFTSLRHLLPELGLVVLVTSLEKNNRSKIFLGSFLLGLSLISSVEYGGAAIISLVFYFLISLWRKKAKLVFHQVLWFLGSLAIIALPYFFFLWRAGGLRNLIVFTREYAQSFYFNSPCRELFPRLSQATPDLIGFFQRLNLYLVPFTLICLLGWLLFKRKARYFPIISLLIIYSLLIFYRPLNTPCVGYLNYGLTFLFLAILYLLPPAKSSPKLRISLFIALSWFLIVGLLTTGKEFIGLYKIIQRNQPETTFLPIAGIKLEKQLAQDYQAVTDFIKTNSQKNDFVYVYPNGPYNQLAARPSPVSVASSWYYDLVPSLKEVTLQELNQRKPKLVVLNTYNARSIKTALNNLSYNWHLEGQELVFEGLRTPIEDFISQNYQLGQRFGLAWVLIPKKEDSSIKEAFLPLDNPSGWEIFSQGLSQDPGLALNNKPVFKVESNQAFIQLKSEKLKEADLSQLPLKVDLGLMKPFSKFVAMIYGITVDDQAYLLNQQLVTGDWQEIWAYLPDSIKLKSIVIAFSKNQGFFWWGKPQGLSLQTPVLFIKNQELEISASAF